MTSLHFTEFRADSTSAVWGYPKRGVPFWDCGMLGFILGSPYLGQVPFASLGRKGFPGYGHAPYTAQKRVLGSGKLIPPLPEKVGQS